MQGTEVGESRSRDELVTEIERLERELVRSRADAERMRTLFASMATYAQKAREGAQRDVNGALHETEAERLAAATSALARTEQELDRARQELARLWALAAATRTRLSTFIATGLEVVAAERSTERGDEVSTSPDLDEADHAPVDADRDVRRSRARRPTLRKESTT